MGLSLQRLVMIGSVSLAGILMSVFAVKTYHNDVWSKGLWFFLFARELIAGGIRWGAAAVLLLGLIAAFMPLYRFGEFQDYFIRFSPIVVWLTFVSFLTFEIAWVEKYGFHWSYFLDTLRIQKKILGVALISIVIFALTWVPTRPHCIILMQGVIIRQG